MLVGSEGSDRKWGKSHASEESALFPLRPLRHVQRHNAAMWVALPWQIPKAHPFPCNRYTKTKKYGPDERTDQHSRKRTKQGEIENISDVKCKTLVISMLTEMIEFSHKMKEEMKPMQSEKKIYRERTVKGRKLRLK